MLAFQNVSFGDELVVYPNLVQPDPSYQVTCDDGFELRATGDEQMKARLSVRAPR